MAKWTEASRALCNHKVVLRLKGHFYKTTVRRSMSYGAKCWPVKRREETKVHVAEMCMLRRMCGTIKSE